MQNRIAQFIIEYGYGHPTGVVSGSTPILFEGLQRGDIDVTMEVWLPVQKLAWDKARSEGQVLDVGQSLGSSWQSAFVIPAYLQEQYPDLDSVEDLKDPQFRRLFQTAESGDKARLVSCAINWVCERTNAAQIAGYGLEDHVHVVNPTSGGALNDDLYAAYERGEPWLGYQWSTNDPALKLELVRLEEPAYSDECWLTTKACAYEDDTILIAVNPELPLEAPDVVAMLGKWDFDIDAYKAVVKWQDATGVTDSTSAAVWWLESNSALWSEWVTDDAASNVQAALDRGETAAGWSRVITMPRPVPTPAPTATPIPVSTPTQTATPTPVPTATPVPTPTSTPLPDPPSIESFAAIPLTIEDGDSSTLDWTTTGASSVTISGVTVSLPVDGRTLVRPAATTTYTLTAANEAGMEVSESVTITVTYPIVSLDVNGTTILSSIGGASQMSVTASRSDGSSHEVDNSLVEWGSSDPWVATVSQGMVTAVGTGNATITASYGEVEAEVPVSVRISERKYGTVRVLYASPSDREFRSDYSEAISHAIVDLQSWYRRQLGGLTFSLYDATPEWCQMSEPADFYAVGHAWNKVLAAVQHCAPVTSGLSDFVWVIYPEVVEDCDEYHRLGEDGHELGRGGLGLTMVPDLEGLTNPGEYYFCGEGPYLGSLGRWIGGLGHELAHGFGLPHPPGCVPWDPAKCDEQEAWSLMHDGYTVYPVTHLLPSDKEALIRSPFFDGKPTFDRDSIDTLSGPTVRGAVLGPDGESSEGLWVSLIADSFWGWGETVRDGTFEIRLPEGSSGSSILSIHSGDLGDCGWRGYYGPGGFTTQRNRATSVEVGGANVTDIEIRLPVSADRLCNRQSTSTIRGIMTTPDGQPVEGVWLWVVGAADLGVSTDSRGGFSIEVPDGSYGLLLDLGDRVVGWYDGQGITADPSEAAVLEVAGEDIEDIEIRLPAKPEDLPCVAWCS